MSTARLENRAIIEIGGGDAEHFLQNLITTDIDSLDSGEARPGALLSPQGKVLFDFLISRAGDGFRLECGSASADDFAKRLTLYRLRAKFDISVSNQVDVLVSWDTDSSASAGVKDTRFAGTNVFRHYGADAPEADSTTQAWHTFRIGAGVGESDADYALGEAFPHDVLLDRNGGISFRKGCFVGQEVVSRMQHRGTARRRLLIAAGNGPLPSPGTDIVAGGRTIGTLGSVAGKMGLAMVRIDRAAMAMARGEAIEAGDVPLSLTIPDWAGFGFPEPAQTAEDN